ncbi:oxidoreductase [Actinoplanes lobatus]|uniref:D-threo-aldose 1-dehydrogenase n=1 Tax=Actinoplanes lobatus TaxID=113568 RepID=A0A7W7MGU3_9ACTN|nr:aldo/keto reductase [Actinoplanes lobatus]MBB4749807.1 D-threo-aldose 1-dehydrogenase [Actinoplanes lobatus]GGN76424.1 oxidoreductase [Actinoplanes lobatus]GIE38543.1 oxidoreductase [Actinoplanes lobatus]
MDPFARVPLGGTDVTVTRLGMGLAPIGGLYSAVGDRTGVAAVDEAWQRGVRFFDTAPLYGAGLSERRAGTALREHSRDGYTLATKVGRRLTPGRPDPADIWAEAGETVLTWDFSADGVYASLHESRERLGVDRIDVLHLHDPDDHFEAAAGEALPALVRLRREGVIGAVSAGMNRSAMLTAFARTGQFDCFLLAGRYSLLDQSGLADLLPECERRGVSVIVGGVYNSGVLADPVPGATYDYRPAAPNVIARAQAMERLCDRYDVPLRAAALQFPLGHPAVASVLVGMRSPEEAADAAAMASVKIPGGLWRDLVAAWLLDPEVPVP